MYYSIIADLPFGIDATKILLHLLNFAILVIGLTFLLYKPILKFIKKRQEDIQNSIDKGEKMQAEADEKKSEYVQKLAEAEAEAADIKAAAERESEVRAKEVIDKAKEDAKAIKANAETEADKLKKEVLADAKNQIADAVITLAENIVERELSIEDDRRIIDKRIDEWSEKLK